MSNGHTFEFAMKETMKEIQKLSELVKNVIPYYKFANPHEKEKIIRIIFSELKVSQNTLNYKCQKGFECFENRFVVLCDPIAWLSELTKQGRLCQFSH